MFKLKYLTAMLIAVAGLGLQQAQAHLLTPDTFFITELHGPSDELNYLQSHSGGIYSPTYLPATSQFLGKFNKPGDPEPIVNGAINISQYVTITFTTATTWHVEWDLRGSGFTMDGMLIKDGRVGNGTMVYRFYGVSADENLVGSGDVTLADVGQNGRMISHISFFGSPAGSVPDGGTTVMLLGAALGSLGMARRFLKR
jgi:VPDSG-CTERM motif